MSDHLTSEAHAAEVVAWRAARDARLRRADGWLALVGLSWLVPGENRVGSHPANEVTLRGHGIPPRVGSLWREEGRVRLVPHPGVELLVAGRPAGEMTLHDDADEKAPTILELGTLRFHLIRRGERIGVRVRDADAAALHEFAGLQHFPIDPSWRMVGRFEPAAADATLEIVDVTGGVSRDSTPGTVVFEREGRSWRLAALPGGEDGSLELVFGDATNGTDSYGGGRFVYSEAPAADGSVVVDFNVAYNPPCAFSPYATCPLPPAPNRLALRVEAGERTYHVGG